MKNKNYSGSLALTKLKHQVINMKTKTGNIEGIFIPIDANHLVRGKNNAVYMPFRQVVYDQVDDYGQNGFIAQAVDGKVYREATETEKNSFRELPILGNIKDFTQSNDNSGRMDDIPTEVESNDDLPF